LATALVTTTAALAAESTDRSSEAVIADYVRMGLNSNLALNNQSLEAEKSLATLREARAHFYPEVSLSARYTSNTGGREISFPLSQVLNPAYQTLNELLIADGKAPRFTTLTDNPFSFLRKHEQDTHLSLRQPIYAPGLADGVKAAQALANAAAAGKQALAQQLRRDITRAWLDSEKARSAVGIADSTLALLAENLRVNESLYTNGKVTQDAVLRARAEWLAAQQQKLQAQNGVQLAASYLNFLLNRPLETPIETGTLPDVLLASSAASTAVPLADSTRRALAARPDLSQLVAAESAAQAELRAARAARRPSLALGIDSGTQGEDYGFGRNYNYTSGSLLLSWNLFDGGSRSAGISKARINAAQLRNQRTQAEAHVAMEVQQARDALQLSEQSLATAAARVEAARAALRIAARKRDAGAITQVEFLDASNSASGAELNLNWTRFDLLQHRADFEYATASSGMGVEGNTTGASR
jgi:outer membrane protein TolC